jgi:LysM repeat protein
MKIKHLLLFLVLLMIVIGVSACQRSASTPPPVIDEAPEGMPIPGTQTMGLFDTFATQTALAGEQGGGAPQETPSPPEAEAPSPAAPAEPQPEQPAQPAEPAEPQPTEPQAPAPISVPPPTPGIPSAYTLQKGEHPYCIARRFNVNPAELLSLNGLNANSVVQPGRELRIPQTGGSFPGTRALRSHPTTYTVRANDTIFSVACYFGGVDPYAIAQANGLSSPYTLSSGQTINIP